MIVLAQLVDTDKPTKHPIKNKKPDKTVVFPKDGEIKRLERAKPEEVGLTEAYVQSYLNENVNDTAIRANRILVV